MLLIQIPGNRSFVRSMGSERESAAIVSALVGLGQGLGLMVTAEGIDDGAQEEALLANGCQQGQGHHFGQAVAAENTAAFFSSDTAIQSA